MAAQYKYIRIKEDNAPEFAEYLPRDVRISERTIFCIGVLNGSVPFGAATLHMQNKILEVKSLRTSPLGGVELTRALCKAIIRIGEKYGYKEVVYQYVYGGRRADRRADYLKPCGFDRFQKEARVYEIDTEAMAFALQGGPVSTMMRRSCVRLMEEGQVRCLAKAPDQLAFFGGYYPDEEKSFLTLGEDGSLECYSVVSNLADGSLFLADYTPEDKRVWDVLGILYMSFGAVLTGSQPQSAFYIAAVEERFEGLVQRLFGPWETDLEIQTIMRASKSLSGQKKK